MANIEDYLDWRGDISLAQDPFNEVDNLILAELSYTDLESIVFDDGVLVPLIEVKEKYFEMHTDEEILNRTTFVKMAPFLLRRLVKSKRFQNMKVGHYMNYVDANSDTQVSATCFFLDDDSCYVAFRGTDNSLIGWKEDLKFSYMSNTGGQEKAVEYLNRHFLGKSRFLRVGGHSKGGNFAVYASAYCDADVKAQIDTIYSNDGPGFLEEIIDSQEYESIKNRIVSFIPESSMIGILLNHHIEHTVIKSSASGVLQHDALSWQVLGNHFVLCEKRSNESEMVDQVAQQLLEEIPNSEKKEIISAIFALLENSGFSTIGELYTNKLKTVTELIKGSANLTKSQQQMIQQFIGRLLKSRVNILTDDVKELADKVLPKK